jgi:hypothetical protein
MALHWVGSTTEPNDRRCFVEGAEMKEVGFLLTAFGVLSVFSTIYAAMTQYNVNSTHGMSRLAGGVGVCALLIGSGLALMKKGKKTPPGRSSK